MFTIGKFAVTDIFDNNGYAHDPRNDFLNWAIIDGGACDYAADAWGSTYGTAPEWYQDWWTIRTGSFDLSIDPNDKYLDNRFLQQAQFVAAVEERHTLWNQPGKLRFLYWLTRGRLGTYEAAIAQFEATGQPANIAAVASCRSKCGIELNLEQQIITDLGFFARLSLAAAGVEEFDFTDINQSAAAGCPLAGTAGCATLMRRARPIFSIALAGSCGG